MVIFYEETKKYLLILLLMVSTCEDDQIQLCQVFNRYLALIQQPIRLYSSKGLVEITVLSQDRKHWRGLISQIKKASEVSQTKNWDATQQKVKQVKGTHLCCEFKGTFIYFCRCFHELFLKHECMRLLVCKHGFQ